MTSTTNSAADEIGARLDRLRWSGTHLGLLLAIGLDRALAFAAPRPSAGIAIRIATAVVFAAALLPIVPTTLPSQELRAAPEFVASGAWRAYTADGRSIMFVPVVWT